MCDRVLVPLPDGRWLALSEEQFQAAVQAGQQAVGAPANAASKSNDEPLLDARELAKILKLPVSWLQEAARSGRIPCVRAGRWRRFKRNEVEAALLAQQSTGGRR